MLNTKPIPQNILAEEIIIGYILYDTNIKQYIIKKINHNFFSLKKHQIIWCYILNTNITKHSTDITIIISQLWKNNILDQIGGIKYILNIIQKSQTSFLYVHTYHYIDYLIYILSKHYIKRLFLQYSCNIFQLSYIYNISNEQIYKKSIQYINTISSHYYTENQLSIKHSIGIFLQQINTPNKNNINILSGFKELDKITHGFKAGELIIIAGRPSMGKTSLAINMTYYLICDLKLQVHIFSLEMSKHEIIDKLIAISSNVSLHYIQNKTIKKEDWYNIQKSCDTLISLPLYIDDNGNASINYIKSQCENFTTNQQTIIIIDYLQLIKYQQITIDNRSQEIGLITRELKLLAKYIQAPIVVLSQLNRNIENRINKRPLLSDLRESGCISYSNIPNVQKNNSCNYTEILKCNNTFYVLYIQNSIEFHQTHNQYTYFLSCYTKILLDLTHNHQIFTYKKWQKEDQVKQQYLHNIKLENTLNTQFIIELYILTKIKRLEKKQVYDIASHEYRNFVIHKHILHNSIEQDADLILMLYKANNTLENKLIDIIIAKHRNGPIGTFQLLFHTDTCKFDNITYQNSIYI